MGILLHYTLLVSFMWMGIEGLRLCLMVVNVFDRRDFTLLYMMIAYTCPLLIVGVTIVTAQLTLPRGVIDVYAGDETYYTHIKIRFPSMLVRVCIIKQDTLNFV